MKKIKVIIVTILLNFSLFSFSFAQVETEPLGAVCTKIIDDMTDIRGMIKETPAEEELRARVGSILEDWRLKSAELNAQCSKSNCVEGTVIWKKTEAARLMLYYVASMDQLVAHGLDNVNPSDKVMEFSKTMRQQMDVYCSA